MSNAEFNERFFQEENKELLKALEEAVDLIRNSKTKAIGPFCETLADRWQKLIDKHRDVTA